MGKTLIIAGIALVVAGFTLQIKPNLLAWFGSLPGDLRFQDENTKVFIPLASMILVSLLLTLFINGFAWLTRFFR